MKSISWVLMALMCFGLQCTSPKPVESQAENAQMSIKNQIKKGAFLVDVRTPEEFATGSYPGAVNIPLDEVESRVAEFKGKPSVVVFCRSGKRSAEAIEILKKNGVQPITNGINAENIDNEMK